MTEQGVERPQETIPDKEKITPGVNLAARAVSLLALTLLTGCGQEVSPQTLETVRQVCPTLICLGVPIMGAFLFLINGIRVSKVKSGKFTAYH